MKYPEVLQLERLLEKYRDTHASKTQKGKIDFLIKQVSKKAKELKDSGYRFFVCKWTGHNDYVPIAGPFLTKKDADKWMLEHGEAMQEELFGIRAPKDMWDEEDIERIVHLT